VKLSTVQLSQLWSVFGSDVVWLIWVSPPSSLTEHIGSWRGAQCSMLALSTLRCTTIMSGKGFVWWARSIWHMCQHRTTLLIFSQRRCLMRSLKLFAKLWAYFPLWIDHSPYGLALPYTLSANSCSQHHSTRGICCHVMVVMCVNTHLGPPGHFFPH